MPSRTFTDAAGRAWIVWDVYPGNAAGRAASALPQALRGGWLAFESDQLKRRLTPIPSEWQMLDDTDLAACCERAADSARPPSARDDARPPTA